MFEPVMGLGLHNDDPIAHFIQPTTYIKCYYNTKEILSFIKGQRTRI
jgi:hypothetical protein